MTDVQPCPQCGLRHVAPNNNGGAEMATCTGHTKRNGLRPCRKAPLQFQDVCEKHGGDSPQALAAAERRRAEHNAQTAVRKLIPDNPEPIRDPIAVLARLGGEADAVRAAIAVKVNEIAELRSTTKDGAEQLNAYATLYERFLDRTAKICEGLVRSNYLERHVAIEEAKLVAVLTVIKEGLRLIPDVEIRRAVTAEIATGLRQLSGSP